MTGSRPGRSAGWYTKLDLSGDDAPSDIRHQVRRQAGIEPDPGGGTLLTASVLVINQRDKLVEVSNDYDVYDGDGGRLGRVVQVGQGGVAKLVRLLGSNDQFKTVRLEVHDVDGRPVLLLIRPAKVVRSRMLVQRPDGTDVGEIRQENFFGRTRFAFLVAGERVGGIRTANWRARAFTITDHDDVEVARITQSWEGLVKALFSTADHYVVQIHRPQPEPLASMIVASALTVDTALKQDTR